MTVSFEGYDYSFPKGNPVSVNGELYDFVMERWPLAFKPYEGGKKEVIPTISKVQTKSVMPRDQRYIAKDMIAGPSERPKSNFEPEVTPKSGTVDADGVQWVGEGLEEDKV